MQENESGHRPSTLHKNELEMDRRPKCKCKTIKLPGDSTGENQGDLDHGNDFLETIPQTQSVRYFA